MEMACDLAPHPEYIGAGYTYAKRRATINVPITNSPPDAVDEAEVMYQRLMLPYYQQKGLNFVPGVTPTAIRIPPAAAPIRNPQ